MKPNKKRTAALLREAAELCAGRGEDEVFNGACCCIEDFYWDTVRSLRSGDYKYADCVDAQNALLKYIRPIKSRGLFWFGKPSKRNVNVRVLALCMAAAIVETEGV